jgi:hypothetical protein
MKIVDNYILMMKTGEFAEFHEKSMKAYPVKELRHACIHTNLEEMTKWMNMNPQNKDLCEIWFMSSVLLNPSDMKDLGGGVEN